MLLVVNWPTLRFDNAAANGERTPCVSLRARIFSVNSKYCVKLSKKWRFIDWVVPWARDSCSKRLTMAFPPTGGSWNMSPPSNTWNPPNSISCRVESLHAIFNLMLISHKCSRLINDSSSMIISCTPAKALRRAATDLSSTSSIAVTFVSNTDFLNALCHVVPLILKALMPVGANMTQEP